MGFGKLDRFLHLFAAGGPLVLAGACAFDGDGALPAPGGASPPPHLLALSTYEASIGSPIDVHGTNFPSDALARISLVFRGRFIAESGAGEDVELEVEPRRIDHSTLRWTGFGPFANPFSASGGEIGRFEGTLGARVHEASGTDVDDADPIHIVFAVKPSLIVHELQPVTASCTSPVSRALSGASYRLRVEALGFTPAEYTYTLAVPSLNVAPVAVRHLASGRFDSVGERGDFRMPEVPQDVQFYDVIVNIEGRDLAGDTHQTSFAIAVHRPLEIFYNGNVEVAEVLAPVPVSACIPGGEAGRSVEYGEMTEETRTRHYEVNWNESWLNSHTVSQGSMETIGQSETNGVGFSTTDEKNWNWSLGGEVGGTFGFSDLVSVGLKVNGSAGGGGSHQDMSSQNRETGVNASTTTTDTEEASTQLGGEQGETFSWEVSSSQSISRTFGGTVIAGTYGVFYRQTLRLLRRAAVVTYNQCGAATVVGDLDFQDWTWSPDLALGNQCPPLPKSNLPEAQCIVPPCGGN